MCKAIEDIRKEGIKIGEAQGRNETIQQYIKARQSEGTLPEQLKAQLVKYFAMSARQADAYMRQCMGS